MRFGTILLLSTVDALRWRGSLYRGLSGTRWAIGRGPHVIVTGFSYVELRCNARDKRYLNVFTAYFSCA
jgi:hypothetical protein